MSDLYQLVLQVLGKFEDAPSWRDLIEHIGGTSNIIDVPPTRVYEFRDSGITLVTINNCFQLALFRAGFEGLPAGINSQSSRDEVQIKLGLTLKKSLDIQIGDSRKEHHDYYESSPFSFRFEFDGKDDHLRGFTVALELSDFEENLISST